jgi:UrcA family protein
MFRTILTGAFALSAAFAACGASSAAVGSGGDDAARAIKVRYPQADLRTPGGAEALAARIELAADRACLNEGYSPGLGLDVCRKWAVADTVRNLDAPLLAKALGLPTRTAAMASR